MNEQNSGISVELALAMLRRRWPLIVLCLVVVTAAAFVSADRKPRLYTATASLNFSNTNLADAVAGLPATSSSSTPQSVQDTNVALLEIGDMAAKAAAAVGHGLTAGDVSATLSVAAEGDTNLIDVTSTTTSPTLAAQIANAYSTAFVTEQNNQGHQYYATALATVNRQLGQLPTAQRLGTQGIALQERAQSLATLADLPTGTVQVAAPASAPSSPSSPKVLKTTLLGALAAVLLGFGLALLLERLDKRIREPRELESIYGLPLLGVVPDSGALVRDARRKGAPAALPGRETEAFHLIRAHLRYFKVDRDLRTLLVTSAASGDGKTTVAKNLALAAAEMGSRVILIETDLRRPSLARQLGVAPGPGLADALIGAVPVASAVQTVDIGDRVDGGSVSRGGEVHVLVAGGTRPPNPGQLLESLAMERLLADAASRYDLVVIDTGPLAVVSDTFPLLGKVDGVILVGRLGHDRRDVAQRLHQTLKAGGSPLLGVVANAYKTRRKASPYGSDYDYADAAEDGPHGTYSPLVDDAEYEFRDAL